MDLELVDRFKHGDETAFDELFHRHKDRVYSLVYRTVGPTEADDVCQDVFVGIYRSLRKFKGDASFQTWLFRVTLNTCTDHLRKKGRRPTALPLEEASELVDKSADVGREVSMGWTQDQIEQAIECLPASERSVVEMHYVHDLSYREMSKALGCPEGTVKGRIRSAVIKLRRRLMPLLEGANE